MCSVRQLQKDAVPHTYKTRKKIQTRIVKVAFESAGRGVAGEQDKVIAGVTSHSSFT